MTMLTNPRAFFLISRRCPSTGILSFSSTTNTTIQRVLGGLPLLTHGGTSSQGLWASSGGIVKQPVSTAGHQFLTVPPPAGAGKQHVPTAGRQFSTVPPPVEYEQGQSPGPGLREYFYYIDHQGMLFLDDARMKNFTSCFKDTKFLEFFFRRLRVNVSDAYPMFPYVSLCGRERNYVRCDDLPIVYTHMVAPSSDDEEYQLRYNHGSNSMTTAFTPSKVLMEPASGRVYHPAPHAAATPVALLHTKLALHLAHHMTFLSDNDSPTHLNWAGTLTPLDHSLLPALEAMADLRRHSLGL